MYSMTGQIFLAFWQATLPVGVISFLLSWWAIKHDYFGKVDSLKDMESKVKRHTKALKEIKKEKQQQKKNKKNKSSNSEQETTTRNLLEGAKLDPETELFASRSKTINPIHQKWLSFGGGFYGVVALLTYIVIELDEIRDFFVQFHGLLDFLDEISFQLLIGFVINSIMNFLWAITWPVYWLQTVPSNYIPVWLLAAYAGYWLGSRLAFRYPPQK